MRALALLLLAAGAACAARDTLDIHFIDTEGGQATLLVTPSGESLLIDAGFPGNDGRDANRIIAAARKAGLERIDWLLVTHYHLDHVGGVPDLARRFPVRAFIDHGSNTETGPRAGELERNYQAVLATGAKRLTVKPGDVLPLKDIRVEVVTARGQRIPKPLPAGGQSNPLCGEEERKAEDKSENGQSIGVVITFGKFRFVDLADLTWNFELDIACPEHFIGPVDLYLTTHHGMDLSGPKAIVHGMRPRVAVMNNGARKGGSRYAWRIVSASPGLEDLWQLHYSIAGGADHNVAQERIANLEEPCQGFGIDVQARRDGSFRVTNLRNGHSKEYVR
jgi:beta-lactamase superfamily II metal-dependent hydrolase